VGFGWMLIPPTTAGGRSRSLGVGIATVLVHPQY
jgi:hypothetical protein